MHVFQLIYRVDVDEVGYRVCAYKKSPILFEHDDVHYEQQQAVHTLNLQFFLHKY